VAHAVRQLCQRIVERETGVAAQAEEDLDAVRLEHLHDRFGAGESACLCVGGFIHRF
jgi:hypothetical protein